MARMRAVADNVHNGRFSSSHPELLRNIDTFTARTANPKAILVVYIILIYIFVIYIN